MMEEFFEFDSRHRVGTETAGRSNPAGWQSPRISFSTGFADMSKQEVPSSSPNREESSGRADDSEDMATQQGQGEDHSSEFEFSISEEFTCSTEGFMLPADELFFKGRLLPLQQSRRSQMVQLLSSSSTSSSSSSSETSSKTRQSNPVVHYQSAPFPYPIVSSSPQAVRCPPQDTPLSSRFPYPIATSTLSGASAGPKLPGVYLPATSKCRRCSKWKEVLGSFRRSNKGPGQKPLDAAADECDHSCLGKAPSGSKKPKVLRLFFRRKGHGHECGHGQHSSKEEPNLPPSVEEHEQGLLDAAADSGSDVSCSCKASISSTDGPGAGAGQESTSTSEAPLRMHDTVPVGRMLGTCRPCKTRDAAAAVRGNSSPGRRSPGRVSPSRVSVKVGDRLPRRNPAVGKIVLKNLERVSSPTKRGVSVLNRENRQPDKTGLYTASVRVMPVLNVPAVSIKPALRGANFSSKSRITGLKHLFTKKDTAASASASLLDNAKAS